MAVGWRIVREDLGSEAFNGQGAKLYGGRWNSPGSAVVYGSEHKSLAALEHLVHFNPRTPNRFKAFSFQFSDSFVKTLSPRDLPKNWREEPPPPTTQHIGDTWARESRSAILAVPSIIIPEELNYLLNPAHPDFKKITVGKPEDFTFDSRLLGY